MKTLSSLVIALVLACSFGLIGCKNVCQKGLDAAMACTDTWCESNPDAAVCGDLDSAKESAEAAFSECDGRVKELSEALTGADGCTPWHEYLDAAEAVQQQE